MLFLELRDMSGILSQTCGLPLLVPSVVYSFSVNRTTDSSNHCSHNHITFRMETDWEQRYREEDTPWDKGKPAPGLVDWLSNQNIDPDTRVLVPGCGKGHDATAWAKAGFETTGMDLSDLALNDARRSMKHFLISPSSPVTFLKTSHRSHTTSFSSILYIVQLILNEEMNTKNHYLTGYGRADISWLFTLSFRLPMRVRHSVPAKRKLLPAFPQILD